MYQSKYIRDLSHGGGIKLVSIAKVGRGQLMQCTDCGDIKQVRTERQIAWVKCPCTIEKVGFEYPTEHKVEKMNLVEGIQHEVRTDCTGEPGKDSQDIIDIYMKATGEERAAIDNVFISLTGWTLESLINMY